MPLRWRIDLKAPSYHTEEEWRLIVVDPETVDVSFGDGLSGYGVDAADPKTGG